MVFQNKQWQEPIPVLIEITSRYGVVYPLKKKSNTYEAFDKFIKIYKPTLIESDKSLEFVNNRLKNYFQIIQLSYMIQK